MGEVSNVDSRKRSACDLMAAAYATMDEDGPVKEAQSMPTDGERFAASRPADEATH